MKHRLFKYLFIFIGILFFTEIGFANVFDQIESKKVAVSLGKVSVYSDTIWSAQTNIVFDEGEMFLIVAETSLEHDDKDQAQMFKWYKVKNKGKLLGWVFGDAIAIIEQGKLAEPFRSFHKKKYQFDNGFEKAMTWIAAINGTESKSNGLANPFYNETYLVVTNENENSVFVHLNGRSVGGESILKTLDIQDITDGGASEIIVQKSNFASGSPVENRDVEAYSFQSGTLRKIFEEHLTLTDGDDTPSPSLFKKVEMEKKVIRIAYPDFIKCENSVQHFDFDLRSATQERCIEYATATYSWDENKKQFTTLYPENRTPLSVFAKQDYLLKSSPSDTAKNVAKVALSEELIWIKIYENFKTVGETTVPEHWLYVRKENGVQGYIEAYKIYFGDFEHADILHEYLNYAPVSRQDWKSEEAFLTINPQ